MAPAPSSIGAAASKDYRLVLWIQPVGDDALTQKLGKATLTVYPQGVKADSLWLDGFTRQGSSQLTLLKPIARLYAQVELSDFSDIIRRMAGSRDGLVGNIGTLRVGNPVNGKINKRAAKRFRISIDQQQWVDVWTAADLPENKQLKKLTSEVLEAVSDQLPPVLDKIEGTPILVRLHTDEYRDVDVLGFRSIRSSSRGHADDLQVGRFFLRATFAEKLWE